MEKKAVLYNLILLWALSSNHSPLAAQSAFTIRNFTNENGLSQNVISDMAMDYSGYLWIGTQRGLIRYDGNSFKIFLPDEKRNDAYHNNIWSLMNTPYDQGMVIRTKDGILYKIIDGRPQVLDSSVRSGDYFIQMHGQYPTSTFVQQFNLPQKTITGKLQWGSDMQVIPLSRDAFLTGEKGNDFLRLYKNQQAAKKVQLPAKLNMLMLSQKRALAICGVSDVYLYDTVSGRFNKLEADEEFKKINLDSTSANVPGFYHGLYSGESFMFQGNTLYLLRINEVSQRVVFIAQFTLAKSHQLTKVVYDSLNSTFFLGTANEGIFQIKLQKIKTFNTNAVLSSNTVFNNYLCYSLLQTSDSTAISPGGFQFTSKDTSIAVKKMENVFSTRLTIAAVGDSAIVCSTHDGLRYYLKRENYQVPHIFNAAFDSRITREVSLLFPEGDSLWVAMAGSLYNITRTSIRDYTPSYKKPMTAFPPIQLFYRINSHEVLISCSSPRGFFKLKLSANPVYEDVASKELLGIRHISPYKNVLIASAYRTGLYVIKDNQLYQLPLPDNIPELKECHSTYIDKQDNIWITTNRGLFKSSASAVVESALKQSTIPYFFCYGRNDGIENLEFNGGGTPAYAVLKDGRLFYPSMGGVVTFNPYELKDRVQAAPITIESISIDKEKMPFCDSVYLRASFRVLDIELGAANLGDPRNLVIEFKIDDKKWERVSPEELRITLVNISSGIHTLTIRKRTGYGNNDFAYTRVSVNKQKEVYERWWFFPLIALIITLSVWLFLKFQTRNINRKRKHLQERVDVQTVELLKMVQVKDMLISIISHDMISPLRNIGVTVDFLRKGIEKNPQRINEALIDIKNTSERILSDSTGIVNWMKYNNKNVPINKQTTHLYSFVESVLDFYRPIAKSKRIAVTNLVSKSKFVEVDQNIFGTILTNIISNAVKNTSPGEVKVSAEADEEENITLRVSDSGAGMSEQKLAVIREVLNGNFTALKTDTGTTPGLGYIIISELAKTHDLFISIDSLPGAGTIASLVI